MKKIATIISLVMVLVLTNCEDFLDIRQEATLPTTGIDYTKSENIFLSVSAAYASLRSWNAHVFHTLVLSKSHRTMQTKEVLLLKTQPCSNSTFNLYFDKRFKNNLWSGNFDIVSSANYAIHQMPLFEEALLNSEDKEYAHQCQGEAKTIRAYAYFNLTRLFGRVPIIDTVLTSEELSAFTNRALQNYTFH
jgi:hypothetical protein